MLLLDASPGFFFAHNAFLLHEMLKMHIVTLKVLDQSLTFRFDFDRLSWGSDCTRILIYKTLRLHSQNWTVYGRWQRIKCSRVWHTELQSLFKSHFNSLVMAEPLPLGVDWIHTTARKVALFDEPLPIHLILILFAWKLLSDQKYFY